MPQGVLLAQVFDGDDSGHRYLTPARDARSRRKDAKGYAALGVLAVLRDTQ
jgi:hypothetical protein